MRLLEYGDYGELCITADLVDDVIPRYAILSHTWGVEAEEVTFEDLEKNAGKNKPGYKKIELCGEQAKRDGLQYFWIDTCCINTANKAEHSSAIQSMFRWYRNAARCYAYLSDVSCSTHEADDEAELQLWDSRFRQSKWFSRGWTLQELLAPNSVDFFSQEWIKLGDKASLTPKIHEITGIPPQALGGTPLSQFSVNDRLRWKDGRVTKREEDGAYSLLGLFDVELAPVYGEGAANAFRRLMDGIEKLERCIQDICHTDPRNDKKRIEETKGGLLADSYRWVLDNPTFQQWQQDQDSRLLWVKGDPGKGKTMLLCGIIDELYGSLPTTTLLAYFFCQATDSRINSATAVLRGLLYMLIAQQPSLTSHVYKKYNHAGKALFEDVNAWVALTEIFEDVLQDLRLSTTYLIIDALDECVNNLPRLLHFIVKQSSASSRVKWIVSSRNWPSIEEQLERAGHKVRMSLELNAKSVAAAVNIFIQQKVYQLAQEKQFKAEIRHAVLQHLTSNANDTFLWVALVCQDLKATPKWNVLKKLALFPPGLDHLYKQMLHQVSESDSAEICQQVLASTAVFYRPVSIAELVALVEPVEDLINDLESVREIVGLCGSFLTLREDTIYFVHQSAKDFLFTKGFHKVFPDGTEATHRVIFLRSLALLSRTLHRDMYSLKVLGFPIDNVEPPDPDPLAASRYPCVYWIIHLYDTKPNSISDLQVMGVVDKFIRKKYLYWLEGLSLCKSIGKGIISIAKLCTLVEEIWNSEELTKLVQDARRFIMYHKGTIESFPLQTYASALLFSPTESIIRRLFQHEEPKGVTVKPAMSNSWSACLQTLEGHSNSVISVAFSHDSTRIASASGDNTVKIWDTSSGEHLHKLEGHSGMVNSVAFSHDSTRIASASYDKTVKIWDASSGEHLQTLEGHSDAVNSVTFSYDSTRIASASDGQAIRIWDASSGEHLHTLECYSDLVNSVVFSHDSTRIVSASWDKTVKIWDASSGEHLHTLEGHSNSVMSVAFSHDSTRIASASWDKTVKIWDASSGEHLRTLENYSGAVNSVAFSHDSTRIASASEDKMVKIWDASSGEHLHTLEGHSHFVWSVAFSHDSTRIASASHDKTVKIWDASSGEHLHTLMSHSNWVNSVTFSHDSSRFASTSDDNTIKIWDASSGEHLHTLEGHSHFVWAVVFSHDSTRIMSASGGSMVKIWDASSGEHLYTLKGHSNAVKSVAFSHDSTRIASTSWDNTVKIWDTSSGEHLHTLKGLVHPVWSVAFSHDSNRIASASGDKTVGIWDTRSGEHLHTLEGHNGTVISVAFSHDSTRIASASGDKTVKIWDASSGAHLHTLEGHSGTVNSVAFSHDSTRIASASEDKTVKIWDASSGEHLLQTFQVDRALYNITFACTGLCIHTEVGVIGISSSTTPHKATAITDPQPPQYQYAALSSDNTWITYDSKNVLRLPSEYRPSASAVSGKMVVGGIGAGKVWICDLNPATFHC